MKKLANLVLILTTTLTSLNNSAKADLLDIREKKDRSFKILTFSGANETETNVELTVYTIDKNKQSEILETPEFFSHLITKKFVLKLDEVTTVGACEIPVGKITFDVVAGDPVNVWGFTGEVKRDDGTVIKLFFEENYKEKGLERKLDKTISGDIQFLKYKHKECNSDKRLSF